jgi:hypothetical protein
MGVLTPWKVTVQCNMVVHSGSSDGDLPLVRHNARVDPNLGGVRICYTQETMLLAELPPSSPPPYIVVGWQTGVGHGKVLISNLDYKGKDHSESISSNLEPRMEWRCPPKILGPLGMMEFSDDDIEEEKHEASDEFVVTLKQRIAALEEQVVELHLMVYEQKDDFDVLRKATTSKLKRFAKALGDPLLYNTPSSYGAKEK